MKPRNRNTTAAGLSSLTRGWFPIERDASKRKPFPWHNTTPPDAYALPLGYTVDGWELREVETCEVCTTLKTSVPATREHMAKHAAQREAIKARLAQLDDADREE